MKKDGVNYELEYLRAENEKLKLLLESKNSKIPKPLETDIAALLQISIRMKDLLEACRAQQLPLSLGREIDRVIKDIENYG